jgi:hypothetical protein
MDAGIGGTKLIFVKIHPFLREHSLPLLCKPNQREEMKYISFLLLLILCANCTGKQEKAGAPENTAEVRTFNMIDIPAVITDPVERSDYLVEHYWDHFDFTDTAYVRLPEITEQALADYINVMRLASYQTTSSSIKRMLKKAEANSIMFTYFTNLYEKYLYDANSPYRNDEFYIPVLETIIESPLTKEKIRPAHLLELAQRNRVGEKAANFTYTQVNGKKATLYNLKAGYTLVFFYNPGCHTCKEIIEQMQTSFTIGYLIDKKELTVLAVYPDEDLAEWKNYLSDIPGKWINSYDEGTRLQDEEIYDLKAIPAIYLLDKEKRVILKDTTFEQLENYFRQLTI